MQKVPFHELIGGLQFLACSMRPDISFAMNAVRTEKTQRSITGYIVRRTDFVELSEAINNDLVDNRSRVI